MFLSLVDPAHITVLRLRCSDHCKEGVCVGIYSIYICVCVCVCVYWGKGVAFKIYNADRHLFDAGQPCCDILSLHTYSRF
jgi:hypothetical protein